MNLLKTFFLTSILIFTIGSLTVNAQTPLPKTISGGVVNGKAASLVKPEYPATAKAEKVSGTVTVNVTIDEQGNVISAKAVSGHVLLREVSEKAALSSKFTPTKLQGQPVKVTGVIIYNFQPQQSSVINNEEKLKFMGLGAFLLIARIIPMTEWEALPKEKLVNEIGISENLKEILLPLTTITKSTTKEEQIRILDQVVEKLEKSLSNDDVWQYNFGKEFGLMMLEISNSNQGSIQTLDGLLINPRLVKMKEMLLTAPADIPQDILEKFKQITQMADVQNLNSDENKRRFIQLIQEVLELISPN